MKSRGGKSQRREGKKRREEEKKREYQRREGVRRKKIQAREKVGKSRNTMFFQWFVAPEGRKVGSLKRRVRSHLARWEMKSCTLLWCEAHLQVKQLGAPHVWSTFGSWAVEKVHAVVARSTFPSQNVQNTARRPQLLNLIMSKSQQFYETSSMFEVGNIKNEAILRDLLQKWQVECRADGLVPLRFAIFSTPPV